MNTETLLKRLARIKERMTPVARPVIRCHWGGEPYEPIPGEHVIVTRWTRLELGNDLLDQEDADQDMEE
jgi:hypothetical protein